MSRSDRPGLDGILVLSKPPGPTSHDVVALVRRLTGTRRVGHGGTLDPFASGVLPVFLGLGTRLVEYHMGDEKAYRATVCFGARSTTDDRDGELEPGAGQPPTRADVLAALPAFRGEIEQRPPAFSALKVGGRRAYELAREGAAPVLATRRITIHKLELLEWDGSDPARPMAVINVECSAGTYIRALARDLGDRLGCGAYLGALVRTASGPFRIKNAHSLDDLREAAAAGPQRLRRLILPIDAGLEHIPSIALDAAGVEAIGRGQPVRPQRRPQVEQGASLRLLGPAGGLVGMGVWRAGRIAPDKVFVAPPVSQRAAAESGGDGSRAAGASRREAPHDGEPSVALRDPRLRVLLPAECVETVAGVDALRPEMGRLYVAVGVFDGLHRGHMYLLRHLRRAATAASARPAVITFDAHPDEVLRGAAPPLLCDPTERLVRLAAAGVEITVVQHFDAELRSTSYERFVEMIRERVEVGGFLMTPDAAFGFERRGTPEALRALGERDGFEVTVVPPLLVEGTQVRSSDIRHEIAAGELAAARRRLGRPYGITGRVRRAAASNGHPDAFPGTEPVAVAPLSGAVAPLPGAVAITFDLPVALPPAGTYDVLVGPAWVSGENSEPASTPATAVVDGDSLWLAAAELPAGETRLRIVLGDAGHGSTARGEDARGATESGDGVAGATDGESAGAPADAADAAAEPAPTAERASAERTGAEA